eukprot:GHVU01151426.1.p1 GENE.GHVU01151426.1~~GHVU01151426.1.p1  ORF type:complete len:143 (-),score=30.16 GHVU01151426.1:44-424(-)
MASTQKSEGKRKLESTEGDSTEDPKAVNKFANDGSFLAMIMQASKKQRVSPAKKESISKSEKSQKPTSTESESKPSTTPTPGGQKVEDAEDDPKEQARKEEFLRAMQQMEEAGLVTDRGIGAGMVK